jgi:thioredoxin 1
MSTYKEINTVTELDQFLREKTDKLIVLDFSAQWCGPCKRVFPLLLELQQKNSFYLLKCDVDESDELVDKFKVKCMPTFVLFKNKMFLERIEGAGKEIFDKISEYTD